MKKLFSLLALSCCLITVNAAVKIDRIEPTDWYVGMKDASLQLMVYGQGVREASVTTDYPGVKLDSLVRLDSPNYLLVYLNIADAKAGQMTLNFKQGRSSKKVMYQLKNRDKAGYERVGFTNKDVLYLIVPDRFANGNPSNDCIKGMQDMLCDRTSPSLRHGGDLEGIRQHLDYFNDLGITALWLTPVMENDRPADEGKYSTYHGYATTNYYRVDPRFGTNADYRKMVDEAHAKGLKVVMDMIFNHCGDFHPWNKDVPSKDWFNNPNYGLQTSYKLTPVLDPYASKVDVDETTKGWFVSSMPDLNQKNPHVLKYLTQNSKWWIETIGIDGIRMDTYPYADRQSMADWAGAIDKEYPNLNVVGETWVTEPGYTAAWQKDSKVSKINSNLKTVMDFAFFEALSMAKNEETDDWWNGFNRAYNDFVYDYLYPNPKNVMAFLENHDTDRYLGNGMDTDVLKQAYALLLTVNRIPQLYYGTEVLMNGTKANNDGYVRQDFPGGFPGDAHNCFTAEGRSADQNAIFTWISSLLHWRQGNAVVSEGTMTQFIPYKGIYVVARKLNGHTVMIILNGKRANNELQISRYAEFLAGHATAKDIITGNTIDLTKNIQLAPKATLIIEF